MNARVHIASQDPADARFFADFLSRAYGLACEQLAEFGDDSSDEEREASIRSSAIVVIVGGGPRCEHAARIADAAQIPMVVYTPPRAGRAAFAMTANIDEAARFLFAHAAHVKPESK